LFFEDLSYYVIHVIVKKEFKGENRMSQDEFLTGAEVAEKCGKSKQAIYSRLSRSLKPFVKVLNG